MRAPATVLLSASLGKRILEMWTYGECENKKRNLTLFFLLLVELSR